MRESDTRAGYQPEKPIEPGAPLFRWPPQPRAVLKWLFGFPGHLWPWQLFFIVLAVASWLYLTPSMETMTRVSAGWIATLFAENVLLLVAFSSAWHLWLYVMRAQGLDYKYSAKWLAIDNPAFLFRNQLRDNVFWNVCSAAPIWTAYQVLTFWLQANSIAPTVTWRSNPAYCVALAFLIPFWLDVHFYTTHRLLHWRPLFQAIHYLHHKNVNIGPWSGLAMHPVEHVVYFSAIGLLWVIPSNPIHAIYLLQLLVFGATLQHHGFDQIRLGRTALLNTTHYMHYLHHKYFRVNYSTGTLPLDKWLGTFHDGSPAAHEAFKARVAAQTANRGNR